MGRCAQEEETWQVHLRVKRVDDLTLSHTHGPPLQLKNEDSTDQNVWDEVETAAFAHR
jgi:hypothetical protein